MLNTGINNLKGGWSVFLKIISVRLQGLADKNKNSGENTVPGFEMGTAQK